MSKKLAHYKLNGYTYTVELLGSPRYQMTVWDDKDGDSYGITDPSLIINVMLNGTRVEAN